MKYSQIKTEILSGLTISTALVPEAISFALLVGVSPSAGLWAAFFMAITTSIFGGRPGIISGATGATAVILASFVSLHGEENLYLVVIIAGLIQLLIWLTNSWKIFKLIPNIVMSGFLISLAILILLSQFKYFQIGSMDLLTKLIMAAAIIISAASMYFSGKKFKFPPALSAILVGSIIGLIFSLPTIEDLSPISNSLPIFNLPKLSINSILIVLPYSFGMAVSGLTESLIAVDVVCEKLGRPFKYNPKSRETLSQAIGNIISGLFSSIGGCVLIGQTNLNLLAGAKTRISSIFASLGLLLIILLLGKFIQLLPLAGLIGVMLIVVYETGDWSKLKSKNKVDTIVLIITILVSIISHNLAIGVIIGSIMYYIIKNSKKIKWLKNQ
jgi:SulP family sulfate permease